MLIYYLFYIIYFEYIYSSEKQVLPQNITTTWLISLQVGRVAFQSSLGNIKETIDTKPVVCKCYCWSSILTLSRVSCICVLGDQFLVQRFQILLISELEQSSQRQSNALAIPGANLPSPHTMPFYLWEYMQIYSACPPSSVQIPPLSHRRQEGCGL